jgi:hypothetical protein
MKPADLRAEASMLCAPFKILGLRVPGLPFYFGGGGQSKLYWPQKAVSSTALKVADKAAEMVIS